jgi:hypothetical protein
MTSLETQNMEIAINELSFLLVTHMIYSDARLDSYGILESGQGVEHFLDRLDISMYDQVLKEQKA